jgi:hypothetical protein
MKNIIFFLCFFMVTYLVAQNKKKQDIDAIKSMCGCYEVNFSFAETFSPQKNYELHKSHQSGGLEWAELVEETPNKIVIQHLLIVKDSTGKEDIVKHWRQDWLYENVDFYIYDKDNSWNFIQMPKNKVKGQWTQKVYQVDDSPRYQGTATWVHFDDRHYWESTTDSPLPRREFTTRSDYNVLKRRNRHEITREGWLHEQDNDKIQRSTTDQLIAQEKGWNIYKKVEAKRCEMAQKYWKEQKDFWAKVREHWDAIFAKKQSLTLLKAVDKKPLFMHLFALKPEQMNEAKNIIEKFIKK